VEETGEHAPIHISGSATEKYDCKLWNVISTSKQSVNYDPNSQLWVSSESLQIVKLFPVLVRKRIRSRSEHLQYAKASLIAGAISAGFSCSYH